MATETRKAFHDELAELNEAVVCLAGMASESIEKGSEAFLDGDIEAAEALVQQDHELDQLTWNIEDRAFHALARQQPMAGDLRTLITIIRVIHEIERVADNMVNVAKATRRMFPHTIDPGVRGLIQKMREQTVLQLRIAVEAFVERDHERGDSLEEIDDVMDELQKEFIRKLIDMKSDEDSVQQVIQLALIGRYYERAADHAVNFGRRVGFMVNGTVLGEALGDPTVGPHYAP